MQYEFGLVFNQIDGFGATKMYLFSFSIYIYLSGKDRYNH